MSGADANKLVFLDESGVNINMTRRYARAPKSERAVDKTPLGTPTNTTILSSVRINGETAYTVYSGGTTKERFKEYLEDILIPTLSEGDIVIMDNMRTHHAKAVTEFLEEKGILYMYLPPYSPDLNPIEKMWSKIKSVLRKLKARSLSALSDAIRYAFKKIIPADCSGWFKSCLCVH